MTALNRLQAQKAILLHQSKQGVTAERKARTRTLIQVGALVNMVGLFEACGIKEGVDLQIDMEQRDKAATLLGILIEAYGSLPSDPSSLKWEVWKSDGIQLLKSHQSKKHYLNE